jgi:hypothetical protein
MTTKTIATTTVDGRTATIIDDGTFRTAQLDGVDVKDEATLARILRAACDDGYSLRGAVTAGGCVWVDTPAAEA